MGGLDMENNMNMAKERVDTDPYTPTDKLHISQVTYKDSEAVRLYLLQLDHMEKDPKFYEKYGRKTMEEKERIKLLKTILQNNTYKVKGAEFLADLISQKELVIELFLEFLYLMRAARKLGHQQNQDILLQLILVPDMKDKVLRYIRNKDDEIEDFFAQYGHFISI